MFVFGRSIVSGRMCIRYFSKDQHRSPPSRTKSARNQRVFVCCCDHPFFPLSVTPRFTPSYLVQLTESLSPISLAHVFPLLYSITQVTLMFVDTVVVLSCSECCGYVCVCGESR